jgi:biotin carboxyl carrier protein
MKLEIHAGSNKRTVELAMEGNRVRASVDGRPLNADATEVEPGVYSILLNNQAFEVRVERRAGKLRVFVAGREYLLEIDDPRQWRRDRGATHHAAGRQQVLAPMPGKVIRALVETGQEVESGQGLIVVEAMKMQNEVRSPKSGKVERLMVTEGQTIQAGDVLCVIA